MILRKAKTSAILLAGIITAITAVTPAMAAELPVNPTIGGAELLAAHAMSDVSDTTCFEKVDAEAAIDLEALSGSNLGVAQVEDYVKIYNTPSEDGDIAGALVNEAVATVVEEDGDFYHITSGDIEGYVSKDALVVGDTDLLASVKKVRATVTADALKVRAEASQSAPVLSKVREGQQLVVTDDSQSDWIAVEYQDAEAYVSADYVTVEEDYVYAKSYDSVAGGAAVAEYGLQFVGNPYVYGGSSLTHGTDCSGFVMALYAQYGVSLPHSSYAQRSVGREVSYSEAKPGDIICYSGHVAIYIGNGQIVHASNAKDGIKVSPATYTSIITVRRIFG